MYIQVILPLAAPGTFTYSVPELMSNEIELGKRIVVQFGKRKIYSGLIYEIHKEFNPVFPVKEIISVLDEEPIVDQRHLQLWRWMADYYICELGEIFIAAVPGALRLGSDTMIKLHPNWKDVQIANLESELLLEALSHQNNISFEDAQKILGKKNVLGKINNLIDHQLLEVEEKLERDFIPPIKKTVRLSQLFFKLDESNELSRLLKRARKQEEIVAVLLDQEYPENSISQSHLLKITNAASSSLKSLEKKGLIEIVEERLEHFIPNKSVNRNIELSENQENAYNEIKEIWKKKNACLLHGVTASGKTHIYEQVILDLKRGEQALYLLPEIALTTQLVVKLQQSLPNIALYHSGLTMANKMEVWEKVYANEISVVVGTRSSVFLPFANLALVVVDEEHDASFKQDEVAPRYNARDVVIVMTQLYKCKVLLGSATPSLISYYNASNGKYGLVKLKNRYQDTALPKIEFLNFYKEKKKRRTNGFFTQILLDKVSVALENNGQAIIYHNRRGYSTVFTCDNCGFVPFCKHCDVPLTYHKYFHELRCHYCGSRSALLRQCPQCEGHDFVTPIAGTEQTVEMLSLIFPDARITRLDFDTTRRKGSYAKIISAFDQGKIDILVGTQMVTKGLDFDNVHVVGILKGDHFLNFPHYNGVERMYQHIVQVAGRAGRKGSKGEVIVQVNDTDLPIIGQILNQRDEGFYINELQERKIFGYPPYKLFYKITCRHYDKGKAKLYADQLALKLKVNRQIDLLGPVEPQVSKIRNLFHFEIHIKVPRNQSSAQKVKNQIRAYLSNMKETKGWSRKNLIINVDA